MPLTLLAATVHAATPAAVPNPFGEKPKLIWLGFTAPKTMDTATVAAIDDAVAQEVARRGFYDVVARRDVETLLGLERQKALTGCSEESTTCLTELSGALGARFVLSGVLAQLGANFQLSLQMQDTQKAQVAARSVRLAKDVPTLLLLLPWVVAEATAIPVPPQPNRLWPTVAIAGGGILAGLGALAYWNAWNREDDLKARLEIGRTVPKVLGTFDSVSATNDSIKGQKSGAVTFMSLGLAAAVFGAVFWPPDPMAKAGLALVPTGDGVAIAGVLP